MTTATIGEYKGIRIVQLDPTQTRMFQDELHRVCGGALTRLLANLAAISSRKYPVAPICIIRMSSRGRTTEYELYGTYLLRQVGKPKIYTFYMGLLLLDWLYK